MKHCDKCGVYYRAEHECGIAAPVESCYTLTYGTPEKPDMVNSPPHYRAGGVECIDAIRAALGHDGFIAYCRGNVIKYQFRADHKNGKEDLKKAVWYSRMASGDDPRAI